MRRIILLGAILVFAASPAFSQSPLQGKIELGVSAGLNMPTGDAGDTAKSGYVFGGSAGYRVIDMLVVGGEVQYYGNGATDDVLAAMGPNADMNMTMIQYTAMAKVMFPVLQGHHVYAKGVGGAYTSTVKFEDPVSSSETSDTNWGLGIGAGFRFNGFSKSSFFAEGMLHHINGEVDSEQFFTAQAGVLFRLP